MEATHTQPEQQEQTKESDLSTNPLSHSLGGSAASPPPFQLTAGGAFSNISDHSNTSEVENDGNITAPLQKKAITSQAEQSLNAPLQLLKIKANSPGKNETGVDMQADIAAMSSARARDVLSKLTQAEADGTDNHDIYIFEAGDKVALEGQVGNRIAGEFAQIRQDLESEEDILLMAQRLIGVNAADNVFILDFCRFMAREGMIQGFEEWVSDVYEKGTAEHRQEHINELWETVRQAFLPVLDSEPEQQLAMMKANKPLMDIGERGIPGTAAGSTADITRKDGAQVEVKTVQRPVTDHSGLSGQMRAGVSKFSGADCTTNEATVFAAFNFDPQNEAMRKGSKESVLAANGQITIEVKDESGTVRNTRTNGIWEGLIRTMGQNIPGQDKVLRINFIIENGASFRLVRTAPDGKSWIKENL